MIVLNVTGANTFLTFDINNNTFNNANPNSAANSGRIITAGTVDGNGQATGKVYGTITNNTFGVAGVANSGGGPGADSVGLFVNGNNSVLNKSEFLIQNNTFQEYGQTGVQIGITGGNAVADATFLGNTFKNFSDPNGSFAGIWAYAGGNTGDTNTLNLLIGGATPTLKNTFSNAYPSGVAGDADVFTGSGISTSTINLSQGAAAPGSTPTTVITINNNITDGSVPFNSDGVTPVNVVPGNPTIPPP
jgi:hypothetical protein